MPALTATATTTVTSVKMNFCTIAPHQPTDRDPRSRTVPPAPGHRQRGAPVATVPCVS